MREKQRFQLLVKSFEGASAATQGTPDACPALDLAIALARNVCDRVISKELYLDPMKSAKDIHMTKLLEFWGVLQDAPIPQDPPPAVAAASDAVAVAPAKGWLLVLQQH